MGARIRRVVSLWLAVVVFGVCGGAGAVSVFYQATDLADVTPGQDLWQYSYTVSGSFAAFSGFNVLFNPTLYRSLENPPPAVNADWSVFTVEPVPGLPADGLYSATAFSATASLADPFKVNFVYLGAGKPGAQPFEVFDDSFTAVPGGITTAIPEPEIYAMMLVGLALVVALAQRRRQRERGFGGLGRLAIH